MSAKWENLGQQLGMDYYLDDIRTKFSNPADCLTELIRQWLQRPYLHTWNHVYLALKKPSIGQKQQGDDLKEKYLPGELVNTFTIACFGFTT